SRSCGRRRSVACRRSPAPPRRSLGVVVLTLWSFAVEFMRPSLQVLDGGILARSTGEGRNLAVGHMLACFGELTLYCCLYCCYIQFQSPGTLCLPSLKCNKRLPSWSG